MRYTRTQIYLDPDDHRRLVEEAHSRGMSLAALVREIVSAATRERGSSRPRGFASIIGLTRGDSTDVTRNEKEYRRAALERRMRKKLGNTPRPATRRGARAKR